MKSMFMIAALALSTTAMAQPPATDEAAQPPVSDAAAQPAEMPPPPPPAGQAKIVRPSPSVEQAFPPPPPKAEYPWCSRTVTDGCKQRNDPGNRK
ncbi:hypothetical protein [Sphingomonas colocasiae]|uniref:Uncharacterized protein n=1 Tax=Sphingomonas colocasiae TaxID=1848973 RepID=A0ABS7PHW7_9SPHN|nr:hypothetical protein [Sphingomonas colocasiae]MBY8820883.1 hypothetical protein [Sphingomonas colocasiae]